MEKSIPPLPPPLFLLLMESSQERNGRKMAEGRPKKEKRNKSTVWKSVFSQHSMENTTGSRKQEHFPNWKGR